MANAQTFLLARDAKDEEDRILEAQRLADEARAEGEANQSMWGVITGTVAAAVGMTMGIDPRISYKVGNALGENITDAFDPRGETTLADVTDLDSYKFYQSDLAEAQNAYELQNEIDSKQQIMDIGQDLFSVIGYASSNKIATNNYLKSGRFKT